VADSTSPAWQSLDRYRNYLLLIARLQIARMLQRKLDPSDLVQETLLRAHAKREQFQGCSEGEWVGWLRTILANTLAEAVRRFSGPERDVALEVPIEVALEETSCRLEAFLADEEPEPDQQAVHAEQLLRLADALAQLPEDHRTALELKHLQGMSVAQIAALLNRSTPAVAGLLRRGLQTLRQLLQD
jgi:RNA polymerase sigma-70 factor (ECF subfamily)